MIIIRSIVLKGFEMSDNHPAITPDDVRLHAIDNLPDSIFEAMNELLIKNYRSGDTITVECGELVNTVINNSDLTADYLYNSNVLKNFIQVYEEIGWSVAFYTPGQKENFAEHWIFTME